MVFLLALALNVAWANVEGVIGVPVDQNVNLATAPPQTGNPEILISRDQYVISYNKDNRIPNWVAWKLEAKQMGSSGRTDAYQQDADLEQYLVKNGEGHAVTQNDYKGSCFDRGHQVPSADRTDTKKNNSMTFMMSNMVPQTAYLNQVIWEHLEDYMRDVVRKQHKKAYVIAGPIFDGAAIGRIGPNRDIAVPSKGFKIIYFLDAGQSPAEINVASPSIAIIMPNLLEDGSAPVPYKCKKFNPPKGDVNDWKQYQTSLDEIERESGLRFH